MSTTLLAAQQELSHQLGDDVTGTVTTKGDASGGTFYDTSLKAYSDDWINTETISYAFITTSGSNQYQERYISDFTASSGLVTLGNNFATTVEAAIGYEIHRQFSPSDKRKALVYAARHIYPTLYDRIWDETYVTKNWLRDGSFEDWSATDALTYWTASGPTLAQISSSPYYKHGSYSAQLSSDTGQLVQTIANNDDLKYLQGKSVTFTIQGWSSASSALRLSVADGVNTESYSGYHPGGSAWSERNPRNDNLYVQHNIDENATQVNFKIHYDSTSATTYIDDARILAGGSPRQYVGQLGLEQNNPIEMEYEPNYYSNDEPWVKFSDYEVDYEGGYLHIGSEIPADRRMRIKGNKVLNFLDASGDASTGWEATINLNQPQLDILVADAAVYLYETVSVPNFDAGMVEQFQRAALMWRDRLRERIRKYAMNHLPVSIRW